MAATTQCPGCSVSLRVSREDSGRKGRCKHCGQRIMVSTAEDGARAFDLPVRRGRSTGATGRQAGQCHIGDGLGVARPSRRVVRTAVSLSHRSIRDPRTDRGGCVRHGLPGLRPAAWTARSPSRSRSRARSTAPSASSASCARPRPPPSSATRTSSRSTTPAATAATTTSPRPSSTARPWPTPSTTGAIDCRRAAADRPRPGRGAGLRPRAGHRPPRRQAGQRHARRPGTGRT